LDDAIIVIVSALFAGRQNTHVIIAVVSSLQKSGDAVV
jgi:hypothetical protein